MLLTKGANKLARNKKGRKPGDVFSPTVEDEKKERIKQMLGMGTPQPQDTTAAIATAAAAATAAAGVVPTAAAANRGGIGADGSAATRAPASGVGSLGIAGVIDVTAGSQYREALVHSETAPGGPPPSYKVRVFDGSCACGGELVVSRGFRA